MSRIKNSSLSYIPGLDGLRAIAVILVILFHYASYFPGAFEEPFSVYSVVGKALSVGWVGVDIFFVISGFLIAKILLRSPVDSPEKYLSFMRRRAWRLLPAYVGCVIVVLFFAAFIVPDSKIIENQYLLWTMSSNITTLFGERSALGGNHFAMFHFWSLALEWQFYLTFPVAVVLLKSARSASLIAIVVAIISRLVLIYLSPANYDNAIYSFTFCRGDALAVGVFLATIPPSTTVWGARVSSMIGGVSFALMLTALAMNDTPFKQILWLQSVGYTAISLSIALVIYAVLNINRDSITLSLLEARPMVAIGRASYSLYIWHLPFYPIIVSIAKANIESAHFQLLFSAGLSIVFTAILGAISYRYGEAKFMSSRVGAKAEEKIEASAA